VQNERAKGGKERGNYVKNKIIKWERIEFCCSAARRTATRHGTAGCCCHSTCVRRRRRRLSAVVQLSIKCGVYSSNQPMRRRLSPLLFTPVFHLLSNFFLALSFVSLFIHTPLFEECLFVCIYVQCSYTYGGCKLSFTARSHALTHAAQDIR